MSAKVKFTYRRKRVTEHLALIFVEKYERMVSEGNNYVGDWGMATSANTFCLMSLSISRDGGEQTSVFSNNQWVPLGCLTWKQAARACWTLWNEGFIQ